MRARQSLVLDNGNVVFYGWTVRYGFVRVRFPNPARPGQYVEQTTGVPAPNGWTPKRPVPAACVRAAARIIKEYHEQKAPAGVEWDAAVAKFEAGTRLRPDTLRTYKNAVTQFRKTVPDVPSPADVTVAVAAEFKRLYLTGTYTKSPKPDAKRYPRSVQVVRNVLRHLSSLWSAHWKELGVVAENPWERVAPPDAPKKVVEVPDEEAFGRLFAWLGERFPDFELLHLFVRVKAFAGCRTLDVCSARSANLDGDVLKLELTKTHKPRKIKLPADIAERLHRVKGATWLWERFPQEADKHWPLKKGRRKAFTVSSLYHGVANVFKKYNRANPQHKIKPHDLRKRAVTLTTLASGSVDLAAEAIDLSPQTARRYYNDAQKSLRGEELLTRMADVLLPKATNGGT